MKPNKKVSLYRDYWSAVFAVAFKHYNIPYDDTENVINLCAKLVKKKPDIVRITDAVCAVYAQKLRKEEKKIRKRVKLEKTINE